MSEGKMALANGIISLAGSYAATKAGGAFPTTLAALEKMNSTIANATGGKHNLATLGGELEIVRKAKEAIVGEEGMFTGLMAKLGEHYEAAKVRLTEPVSLKDKVGALKDEAKNLAAAMREHIPGFSNNSEVTAQSTGAAAVEASKVNSTGRA